jgi:hypothetical protein
MSGEPYNERQYRIWIHTSSEQHRRCGECQSEIIWMRTERGKNIPVDPRKVTMKTSIIKKLLDCDGVIRNEQSFSGFGWVVHFDTCVNKSLLQKNKNVESDEA